VSRIAARAEMAPLLEAGVRIQEFRPTMLHCKVLLADEVAVCGSANINMRSMHQDDEVVVLAVGGGVSDALAAHFEEDLARSEPMDPERFEDRSPRHRAAEAAVSLLRRFL
jgi:cardiolipin synthase